MPHSSRRSRPRTSAPAACSTPRRRGEALLPKAIILDVDGTLAETEEAHRAAFNAAFAADGLDWCWSHDDYRDLLTTTGGRERIARYMAEIGAAPNAGLVAALHARKNAHYGELVAGGAVVARPGVMRLIDEARRRDVRLAIATTTSRVNLSALLRHVFGADAAGWFDVIVAGEDVAVKKPDPEAYDRALAGLGLATEDCVAIEDSRGGLEAALAAGLTTVVTPSRYTIDQDFAGAALVVPDLAAGIDVERLAALFVRA